MTLAYQRFTAVLLLIYGSLFMSGVYYRLSVFRYLASRQCTSHTALSVRVFLASKQITVLEHHPYSPDVAPMLFSVPADKANIQKKVFYEIDDIRTNTTEALKASPKNQFQNYFEGWTRRWHRCITSQVEYFEDEDSDIQQ
jgi:NAD-dependent oxidoreductase involved in siderophore biosynthesis